MTELEKSCTPSASGLRRWRSYTRAHSAPLRPLGSQGACSARCSDYGVQHLLVLVQRLDSLVFGLREFAQHVHRGDATVSVQILYYRYRLLQPGPSHVATSNPG